MAAVPRATAGELAEAPTRDESKSGDGRVPCTHAASIVNHGAVFDSSDPRLAFNGVSDCDACGKGFLNWICLGCLQVRRVLDAVPPSAACACLT